MQVSTRLKILATFGASTRVLASAHLHLRKKFWALKLMHVCRLAIINLCVSLVAFVSLSFDTNFSNRQIDCNSHGGFPMARALLCVSTRMSHSPVTSYSSGCCCIFHSGRMPDGGWKMEEARERNFNEDQRG